MKLIDLINERKETEDDLLDRAFVDFTNQKVLLWETAKEKKNGGIPKVVSQQHFTELMFNTKREQKVPNYMVPNFKKKECMHDTGTTKISYEEIEGKVELIQFVCNNCGVTVHEF